MRDNINQIIEKYSDDRIPEKFKEIEKTKITFATAKKEGRLANTDNTRIYAYLPTDLNFGFPFLVNGDFIPDGSREKLFWDLGWNQYLFEQAGYTFVEWLQKLYFKYKDSSAIELIPDANHLIKVELDEAKREYLGLFKKGMAKGINDISFIPDTKGKLSLLTDLVIDLTGLLTIMGESVFRKCTGIEAPIMNASFAAEKSVEELMIEYKLGKRFSKKEVLDIVSSANFEDWLKVPENNISFLHFLNKKGWYPDFMVKIYS